MTKASPVVTAVSQATRPSGSFAMMASRIASEIWSAILSGWPSVTDSEVNRWRAPMKLSRVGVGVAARVPPRAVGLSEVNLARDAHRHAAEARRDHGLLPPHRTLQQHRLRRDA